MWRLWQDIKVLTAKQEDKTDVLVNNILSMLVLCKIHNGQNHKDFISVLL